MALQRQLTQLEGAGLIRLAQVAPELAYLFRHALIEQAAHGSLVRADRQRLHRLAGETLEALYPEQLDDLAATLALHFAAAGQAARAVAYYRRAARLAQARYANPEAVQHLQAALALLEPTAPAAERAALLEALADVHQRLGEPAAALARYQAALAALAPSSSVDGTTRVRLYRKIIESIPLMAGSLPLEMVEAALRENAAVVAGAPTLAQASPPHPETVRLLSALAGAHAAAPLLGAGWTGDPDAAERYAAQAVSLAEPLGDAALLSVALGVLAGVLYVLGRQPERLAAARRRLALGPALDDPHERVRGLIGAGAALAEVGEYAQALPLLEQAEAHAAAIRAVTPRVYALRLSVHCWFGLDRWPEMLASVARCRALAAEFSPEQTGPLCFELALSAAVHALRGQAEAAQSLRNESFAIMASVSGPVETWARQQHY